MIEDIKISPEELKELPGIGPSSSGGPESRFIQEALQYFREWMDVHVSRINGGLVDPGASLLLIYAESPKVRLGLDNYEGGSYLRSRRKLYSLESGAAVCNENLETILRVVPSFENIDMVMDFVENQLTIDKTFVLILFGQARVLIHYSGDAIEDWLEKPYELKVQNVNDVITPDIISHEVGLFHDDCTRTHLGSVARFMWCKNDEEFWLDHAPESRIQSGLLIHLKGRFRTAGILVHEEAVNPGGRTDIEIFRAEPCSQYKTATTMLELKFLSPFNTLEVNREWAIDGVGQAAGYRKLDTDACFALVFDARKDKADVLSEIMTEATKLNVRAERYEMELPKLKAKRKSPTKNAAKKG